MYGGEKYVVTRIWNKNTYGDLKLSLLTGYSFFRANDAITSYIFEVDFVDELLHIVRVLFLKKKLNLLCVVRFSTTLLTRRCSAILAHNWHLPCCN